MIISMSQIIDHLDKVLKELFDEVDALQIMIE